MESSSTSSMTENSIIKVFSEYKFTWIYIFSTICYYGFGVAYYTTIEQWDIITCIYFITLQLLTIGAVFVLPTSDNSRIFTAFYSLIGTVLLGFTIQSICSSWITSNLNSLIDRIIPSETSTTAYSKHLAVSYAIIFIFFFVGLAYFTSVQPWNAAEVFYFVIVSMTTVGTYDFFPTTPGPQMFFVAWIYWTTFSICHLLNCFDTNRVENDRELKYRPRSPIWTFVDNTLTSCCGTRTAKQYMKQKEIMNMLCCIFLSIVYYGIGIAYYSSVEKWSLVNCIYFITSTLLTIGNGNFAPTTDDARIFSAFYILGGVVLNGYTLISICRAWLTAHVNRFVDMLSSSNTLEEKGTKHLIAAYFFIVVFFFVGFAYFISNEPWNAAETFYFVVMSMLTEGNFDFLPSSDGSKMFMVVWMYWYMLSFYHLLTTYLNNIAVVKAVVVRMADKKIPLGSKLNTDDSFNSKLDSSSSGRSNNFPFDQTGNSGSEVEMEKGRQNEQKRASVDLSITTTESITEAPRQSIGIVGSRVQSQSDWTEAGL